ncbi:Cytochrome c oxidase subunit IV family and Cytochrome c oxidase subunit IV family-containing protein [Strongyloides ratti]|uniref:Cytochrome c oxidase subunit 4 n=1 Tax=Strongyloides ratti TaxID=34506 RepID=A0A090LCW3_STRRB|nr:Cytochrome c oxidase subunit IV family and Cytochrome c oxidase subunit IV family-containing protein [Strongyloides ratti]CEF65968.1 Cytochrome c oxidase subunit IV family and Cytochrome c oxidase subunit IV family-containing protein [Strongyloides ratti]
MRMTEKKIFINYFHSTLKDVSFTSIHLSRPAISGHEYAWGLEKAAGREVVGYGSCGDETYQDRLDYWYPSIRFRKDDEVIAPIRQKELGSWKNLSNEEKKLLYRYSFKQTLAEFEAPSGYWKVMLSIVFTVLGCATLFATFLTKKCLPPIPPTFDNEYKEASVERMLVLEKGNFLGPAKYWDYENNKWKK